jgi:hypothetical protein
MFAKYKSKRVETSRDDNVLPASRWQPLASRRQGASGHCQRFQVREFLNDFCGDNNSWERRSQGHPRDEHPISAIGGGTMHIKDAGCTFLELKNGGNAG